MTNVIPFRPRATTIEATEDPATKYDPYYCSFFHDGRSDKALLFACLPKAEGRVLERFMRKAFSSIGASSSFDTEQVGDNFIIDVCGTADICREARRRIERNQD
jgi:hypothetical protein